MNTSNSPEQLILELTQAFERLPILEGQAEYLNHYIQFLAEKMSIVAHMPYPNNYLSKSAMLIPDLEGMLVKIAEFRSYQAQLHKEVIVELAKIDLGATHNLHNAFERLAQAINQLIGLQNIDRNTDPINTGGRPAKPRALDLAKSLAGNYWQLTGKPPTILVDPIGEGHQAQGDFLRLVDDIFGILQIEGSPEYFAKRSIEHFNKQKEITPP